MSGQLIKYYKRIAQVGTQAGRSSGHGTPFVRAGNKLIQESNKKGLTKEFATALKKEGKRLIQKGSSINH